MTQPASHPDPQSDPTSAHVPTSYHDAGRRITLFRHDCVAGMRRLAPGSVDMIATSPPYNIGKEYSSYDDTIARARYLDDMEKWGQAAKRVLADTGSLFLNLGGTPRSPYGPHEVLLRLREHFVLQNEILVVKSLAIDAEHVERSLGIRQPLAMGHFRPLNGSPRYLSACHEYVFHLTKRGDVRIDKDAIGVPYQDKSNITRWGTDGQDVRDRGTVWFIPYPTITNRDRDRPHPASFPVALPRRCIQLHGVSRTRLVLDPFCGIGTTAVACRELGVAFVGFEIARDYFDCAVDRLQQDDAAAQPGLFDNE